MERPAEALPQNREVAMQIGGLSGYGAYAPQGAAIPEATQPAMGAAPEAVTPVAPQPQGDGAAAQDALAEQKAFANVMNDRFMQDCQTCKSRRYQDGSNDGGVSFQTPTHVSPGASFSAVASHEQEHVSRNRAKAEAEGGEVVSSTVVLHGDICPECGKYYIAGGTTYTTTKQSGSAGGGESGGFTANA